MPYRKSDDKKPFSPRSKDAGPRGKKPFKKPFGKKPYAKREDGDARAEKPRFRSDAPREGRSEDKPYRKPYGDKKPYGEKKSYRARPEGEFKKPYRPRTEGDERPRKPYDADRPRKSYSRDGEDKPYRKPYGDKKPYGEKKSYRARSEGEFKKPYRPRTEGDERPRKPYDADRPRKSYSRDGDDKPFRKSYGEKKPYRPRGDDDRPARSYGERKPYGERKEGDFKKPYRPRSDGDAPRKSYSRDGDDKPFRKSYGEKKPYGDRARSGEGRFEKRDDFKKSYRPRAEGDDRPRKSYSRDGDDKPFRKSYGEKKPYGDKKSFGDRPRSGEGRFEKRDGFRKPFNDRDRAERPRKSFSNAKDEPSAFPGMRIAKVVARAGVGSRRDVEAAILDGRVTVNGKKITSPALNVTQRDHIMLDGKVLPEAERTRLWLYHKPKGLVTTERDLEDRPTVFDNLPENLPRVVSIGRLDINTEGLLLLTNDGGLKRALELPSTGWLRRYRVRVFGKVKKDELDALSEGVTVDGVEYGPVEALVERVTGDNTWLTLGIREGKNREIKNIAEHLGLSVSRLIRVSFGPFQLRAMEPGEVYEISSRIMKEQLGEEIIKSANLDFSPDRLASPRERQRLEKRKLREQEEGSATGKAARFAALQSGEAPRRIRRSRDDDKLQLDRKTISDRKGRKIEVSGKPRKSRDDKSGKPFKGKGRRSRPFKK